MRSNYDIIIDIDFLLLLLLVISECAFVILFLIYDAVQFLTSPIV